MLLTNILSVLIAAVIFLLCYLNKRRIFREFDTFIRRVALLVFLSGFVIYFIGFRSGHETVGTQLSWYASFFRPLLSSMEMPPSPTTPNCYQQPCSTMPSRTPA